LEKNVLQSGSAADEKNGEGLKDKGPANLGTGRRPRTGKGRGAGRNMTPRKRKSSEVPLVPEGVKVELKKKNFCWSAS